MQVSVESPSAMKKSIKVVFPKEVFDVEYQKQIKETKKVARVDGFRKGHVPDSKIVQLYGSRILNDAINEVISNNYDKIMDEAKVDFINRPSLQVIDVKEKFEIALEGEVIPEIELKDYTGLQLKKLDCELTDADLETLINNLRKQRATFVEEDKVIEASDKISINFLGRCDGVEFEGGKAENYEYLVAANQMIPGFDDQILGHKVGDSFTIKVKFPDEYHAENLKGKDAEFDIVVNKVYATKLPELNEEFCKAFGVENGNVDEFKKAIKSNMERERVNFLRALNRERVYDAISKEYADLECPNAAVEEAKNFIKNQFKRRFASMGIKDDKFIDSLMMDNEHTDERAKNLAIVRVVLENIIRIENLQDPVDDQVNAEIDSYASAYEKSEEVVAQIKKDQKQYRAFKQAVFDFNLVDKIFELAKAEVEKVDFNTLTEMSQKQAL